MLFRSSLATAAALCAWAIAAPAHAVVSLSIDEFNDAPQQILQFGTAVAPPATLTRSLFDNRGSTGAAAGAIYDSIIGGYRDVIVKITQTTSGQVTNVFAGLADDQVFSHTQGSGVKAQTTVVWDGLGAAGAGQSGTGAGLGGGSGADLSGFDYISINLIDADANITWLFELMDGTGKVVSASIDTGVTAVPTVLDPLLLSSFTGDGGFAFSDVMSITLRANAGNVSDFDTAIDWIRLIDDSGPDPDVTVPEPASLGLLGLGLLGLTVARRRRRLA